MLQRSLLVILTLYSFSAALAQVRKQGQNVFKDSLDGAFDFSYFLKEVNGFVPVPFIITEPALGGFGGAMAFLFIRKEMPFIDSLHSDTKVIPVHLR